MQLSTGDVCSFENKHSEGSSEDVVDISGHSIGSVHADLMENIGLTAKGGFPYVSKFNDYRTRFREVYLLQNKSDALASLQILLKDVAIPKELWVVRPGTGKGFECTGQEFRDYC